MLDIYSLITTLQQICDVWLLTFLEQSNLHIAVNDPGARVVSASLVPVLLYHDDIPSVMGHPRNPLHVSMSASPSQGSPASNRGNLYRSEHKRHIFNLLPKLAI